MSVRAITTEDQIEMTISLLRKSHDYDNYSDAEIREKALALMNTPGYSLDLFIRQEAAKVTNG